jgi:hypothetical protein
VFRASPFRPVRSASGLITFPGIGRTANPSGKPPLRHRLLVRARMYEALYGPFPGPLTGLEFDAARYHDDRPPPPASPRPTSIFLLPSPLYPFPAETPLLRGRVVDAAGDRVAGALVAESTRERVLTTERGTFALPLRWISPGDIADVDVTDRAGTLKTVQVAVPDDLEDDILIQMP